MKETISKLECKRCKHTWYPNKPGKPVVCPRCKSPWWNIDKRPEKKEEPSEGGVK